MPLCDNDFPFGYETSGTHEIGADRTPLTSAKSQVPIARCPMMHQSRRLLGWALVFALLAYVTYLSFRAYLGPEFIIGFANLFAC